MLSQTSVLWHLCTRQHISRSPSGPQEGIVQGTFGGRLGNLTTTRSLLGLDLFLGCNRLLVIRVVVKVALGFVVVSFLALYFVVALVGVIALFGLFLLLSLLLWQVL